MSTDLSLYRIVPQGEESLDRLAALLFLGYAVECSIELIEGAAAFNLQLVPRWGAGILFSKGGTAQRSISVHRYTDQGTTIGAIVERGVDSAELSLVGALDDEVSTNIEARLRGQLILEWLTHMWAFIDTMRLRRSAIAEQVVVEAIPHRYERDANQIVQRYEIEVELREPEKPPRVCQISVSRDDAFERCVHILLHRGFTDTTPTRRGIEAGAFECAKERAAQLFVEAELRRSGRL